ncbi:DUF4913 domain-containing protein [Arthrobacter halodurans]|uniref:DUF4913 domain-containing protein n=1 Tax=Arthrobacter halodurans TaxID=516699 RepID=A0ABV4UR65_9MICC
MADDWDFGQDPQQEPGPQEGESAEPKLFFGSVNEFVREHLVHVYRRKVGPQGQHRWAAEWWRSAEAISRLESLWRSWEHLRLEGTIGMSVWWLQHADPQMRVLMDPDGPFAPSEDENRGGDALPYVEPPTGTFPDVR